MTVLFKCSPASDSEISLKIGHCLMKSGRTKQVCHFLGHPVLHVLKVIFDDETWEMCR